MIQEPVKTGEYIVSDLPSSLLTAFDTPSDSLTTSLRTDSLTCSSVVGSNVATSLRSDSLSSASVVCASVATKTGRFSGSISSPSPLNIHPTRTGLSGGRISARKRGKSFRAKLEIFADDRASDRTANDRTKGEGVLGKDDSSTESSDTKSESSSEESPRSLIMVSDVVPTKAKMLPTERAKSVDRDFPTDPDLRLCFEVFELLGDEAYRFHPVRLLDKSFFRDGQPGVLVVLARSAQGKEVVFKIGRKWLLGDEKIEQMRSEMKITRFIQSIPGTVNMINASENPHFLILVVKYYPGGDLLQYLLHLPKKRLLREKAWPIFLGLVQSLRTLHEYGIAHRDIKLENIFLDSDGSVHIGDFGISAYADSRTYDTVPIGTLNYASPQMLNGYYNVFKQDVWALGILYATLLTGRVPFSDKEESKNCQNIRECVLTLGRKNVSDSDSRMIKKLLDRREEKRYSIEQLARSRYLR